MGSKILWIPSLLVSFAVISLVAGQKPVKPVKKEIAVEDVKFAVFERDLSQPKEYITAKLNEKVAKVLQADQHRKIQLKFVVKDKKGGVALTVHQAFVALVHVESQREVIYVAESDKTTKAYTFDLDLKTHHKDFFGMSGKYAVRLILGDAAVSNPVDWTVAEITITVPAVETPPMPKSKEITYNKLPEIQHQFRQPEAQPPTIVSTTFAALCGAPFLILFGLWLRIGLNFGNLRPSLWALGFHLGLAAIFALYYLYWLKLNMFQTLQYLAIIGTATFVCGNRFLHAFNQDKKAKTE
ncbi:oligosaccharyltransferase subunit ribophorin II domain-containing protein [Ditylenchus destructor]|uniref:Dolichyl-diphosphooligosaccharide--protein glycosyltransferase subunit 2 n=1 Tax=Ditylenchus destructor TaxID=166010 RepID=A0AAD4NDY4_9BILA|nr:oligosaccharyltransferase subunit ribophorin II domain-containing protein [Ditylenchus destructor]